jgi:hypothetical protein
MGNGAACGRPSYRKTPRVEATPGLMKRRRGAVIPASQCLFRSTVIRFIMLNFNDGVPFIDV